MCRSAPISAAASIPRSSPRPPSGIVPDRLRTFSVTFETRGVRRERLPAGDGARRSAPTTRAVACTRRRYRPHLPRRDPPHRAADPPHRAGAALCAVEARPRQRLQGRADRRGRRRGLRRLRHLQGSEDPPLLRGRAAARKRRPLLFERLYPYLPQLSGASRQHYLRGLLRRRPRRDRRSAVLAPAALPHHRRRQAVLLRPSCARQLAGYDALDELRASLPADFARWHPLSPGAVSRDRASPARLHPVVAGRPRGHGARGRGPLPVPRPSRRRVRGAHSAAAEAPRAPREAHPARGHAGPPARARSATAPSSPTARRTASPSSATSAPAYVGAAAVRRRDRRRRLFRSARGRQARRQVPRRSRFAASATTWPSSACSRRSSGIANSSQGATVALRHPRHAVA